MQTVDSIMQVAERNPYGFTLNIRTGELVQTGIPVAYAATQNSFGPQGISRVLQYCEQTGADIVGGWLNEDDGQYYFDACKVYIDRREAIQAGIAEKQLAIYDIDRQETIDLQPYTIL